MWKVKFKNLGSYSSLEHQEARAACEKSRAVFYPEKQGIIFYSVDATCTFAFTLDGLREMAKLLDTNIKEATFVIKLPLSIVY